MKRLTHPIITLGLSLILALFSAALTYSAPSEAKVDFSAGPLLQQVTPTPRLEDTSEVGSTDEIVLMGGVISVIILVPILMKQKPWR